jgi:hypothetical protein
MYTYIYIYRAPLDIVEGMSPKMQPTPKEKTHGHLLQVPNANARYGKWEPAMDFVQETMKKFAPVDVCHAAMQNKW